MNCMENISSNVPNNILKRMNQNFHNTPSHPLCLIKQKIYYFFDTILKKKFTKFDDLPDTVSVQDNFDLLLIPKDHPSRSRSDTYYINDNTVLRTHTSCHQNQLLAQGEENFLVTGDVYRKDEIDKYHFPIFHQMEGVSLVDSNVDPIVDLKNVLSGLIKYLFPQNSFRFNNDYFPFTNPSFEVEVYMNDKWVEILGCGVIHTKILDNNNIKKKGWAFGLGLERLAMILYNIPDIRLFWSTDERFINQFKNKKFDDDIKFISYSPLSAVTKDISFWIDDSLITKIGTTWIWTQQNDFFDITRTYMDDDIESVILFDKFFHKQKQKYSQTWRLILSPNNNISNPAEFNASCNDKINQLKSKLTSELGIEFR